MSWTLFLLLLVLLALALPDRIARGSWRGLLTTMAMCFIVVVLPLFVFFVSSFLVYDLNWRGACRFGWLDCCIASKLVFAPFVLAATYALYRLEVLRENIVTDRWLVLAIFVGAIVATACAIFGLLCLSPSAWLLVPIYVAVWYVIRAVQLIRRSTLEFGYYFWATLALIPSWVTAWFWAKHTYESLPELPPSGCFVVNAAGRGHPHVVGPFFEIEHRGQWRRANQQLITLWQFEILWRKKFPRGHALFRAAYNRLGPQLASKVRSPWQADLVFLALKPAEWLARRLVHSS